MIFSDGKNSQILFAKEPSERVTMLHFEKSGQSQALSKRDVT